MAVQQTQHTEGALVRAKQEINGALSKYAFNEIVKMEDRIEAAFQMADGIAALNKLVTDEMMQKIMPLQGKSLGFLTDKDKGTGYTTAEVKDCIIEALLRGLRPVGNEFNIIAGKCYATQGAFARLVREFPGLTNLAVTQEITSLKECGATVVFRATWNIDGKPMELESKIPIKVNAGMGPDAILGKAKRKGLKLIYDRLTGSELIPDGEASDVVDTPILSGNSTPRSTLSERVAPAEKTDGTTAPFATHDAEEAK